MRYKGGILPDIKIEQIQNIYSLAKKVYEGKITKNEAKAEAFESTGMSVGSAYGYILVFLDLMSGKSYQRTINAEGTDYFLRNILKDYGEKALLTAISSMKKHLDSNTNPQHNIREILNKYIFITEKSLSFKDHQKNFNTQVSLSLKDKAKDRKARLNISEKLPRSTELTIKVYARNPDVVAEVLERAKGFCENCKKEAPFQRAKDNTPYLEVHHKKQLAKGGLDTVENAQALCPNCHRELHYGVLYS